MIASIKQSGEQNLKRVFKIAVIAGEESGDLLAADIIRSYIALENIDVRLIGVGGAHLEDLGLKSFFDREDIALIGIGAVLKRLPRLLRHIYRLSSYLIKEKPDFLLLVDSPDFTHRVARRVRKFAPSIPIIQYVAPSVWAWRPQRAKAMRKFIDLLLVILPFEPKILAKLGGPEAVYTGHRLLSFAPLQRAYAAQQRGTYGLRNNDANSETAAAAVSPGKRTLLLLPGSRISEITYLMPIFAETVAQIRERCEEIEIILPTLPHLEEKIKALSANWLYPPKIITEEAEKWKVFGAADAALAASGTVALELALCAVPTVLAYKLDWFTTRFILPQITIWSAALPNIITDEVIVPEYFNEFVQPGMLARQIERVMQPGAARQAQLEGFARLRIMMQTDKAAGRAAAEAIKDRFNIVPKI